jgi:hypothetical protein
VISDSNAISLRPEPLQELEVWLQRYRSQMEEQFGRLDDVLSDLKAGEKSTLKERAKRGVSKAKPR